MKRVKTVSKEDVKQNGVILPEPSYKRIPVRINRTTVILVREGLNTEEHIRKFKDKLG